MREAATGSPRQPARARRGDLAFAALALGYSALLFWPTRALPYHWDAATFVAPAARDLLARGFSPLVAYFSDFAHPPLFVATLALWQAAFGPGLPAAHAFVAWGLPLLLLATYALGSKLYDRAVGAAAAALVGCTAVVVAEYGQVYFDLPLAALLALALLLWTRERRWAAGLVLGACAGIKVPALVVPCALIAAELLRDGRRAWPRLAPLALPFAVLAAWLLYHHAVEGFWLSRPGRASHVARDPFTLLDHARAVAGYLGSQGRWAGYALGLAAATALLVRQRPSLAALCTHAAHHGTRVLLLVALGGVAFFALAGEFAERYGILVMASLALLAAAALRALLASRTTLFAAAVALGCALQLPAWYPREGAATSFSYRPDADLRYLDVIALGRQTAQYMTHAHPGAHVYGSWPETYWLGEPYLGYTPHAFAVSPCHTYGDGVAGPKVIVGHVYTPEQRACWKLIKRLGARPEKVLQVGDKWVQIHVVP